MGIGRHTAGWFGGLLLIWVCAVASGEAYYVGPSATGDGSGSDAGNLMAWANVEASTIPGDEIHIVGMDGTISESLWPAGRRYFASQVSRWDTIAWTLSAEAEVFQFVTLDPGVVGPVSVTGISPSCQEYTWTDPVDGNPSNRTDTIHGSMLNPSNFTTSPTVSGVQGFDTRVAGYDQSVNVGWTVAQGTPLALDANDSLVSVRSFVLPGDGDTEVSIDGATPLYYTTHGGDAFRFRPALRNAAILTCLAAVPSEPSFRPTPYGTTGKVVHAVNDVDLSILPDLTVYGTWPAWGDLLSTANNSMNRAWVPDFLAGGIPSDDHHPWYNMPNYGENMSDEIDKIATALLCDTATMETTCGWPSGWKTVLAYKIIQFGIDTYGVWANGGGLGSVGGGIGQGRKFPILFAGLALDYADYRNVGTDYGPPYYLQAMEDQQKFYVTRELIDRFPLTVTRTNCRVDAGNPQVIIDDDGGDFMQAVTEDGRSFELPYDRLKGAYWVLWDAGGADELRFIDVDGISGSQITLYSGSLTAGSGKTVQIRRWFPQQEGLPGWMERPYTNPFYAEQARGYQVECTAISLPGQAMAAMALKDRAGTTRMRTLWNAPHFFDYMDWYEGWAQPSHRSNYSYIVAMWDNHRASLEPVPSPVVHCSPADGATGVSPRTHLTWGNGGGYNLVYDVYFDSVDGSTLVSENQVQCAYDPGDLDDGATYTWKVVAKTGGNTAPMAAISFTTADSAYIATTPFAAQRMVSYTLYPTWYRWRKVDSTTGSGHSSVAMFPTRCQPYHVYGDSPAYVFREYPAGYFDENLSLRWKFGHDPDMVWWPYTYADDQHSPSYVGLSNSVGDFTTLTTSGDSVWVGAGRGLGVSANLYFVLVDDGVPATVTLAEGVEETETYYVQLDRSNTATWTVTVWTGGYGGSVVATHTLMGTDEMFDTLYAFNSAGGGASDERSTSNVQELSILYEYDEPPPPEGTRYLLIRKD